MGLPVARTTTPATTASRMETMYPALNGRGRGRRRRTGTWVGVFWKSVVLTGLPAAQVAGQ